MTNKIRKALLLLFLCCTVVLPVAAEPHTVTLHNRTGVDLYKLFLAHHSAADWDENEDLLDGSVFMNGAEVPITLNKKAASWDLRIQNKAGGYLEWSDLDLNGATDVVLENNGVARIK